MPREIVLHVFPVADNDPHNLIITTPVERAQRSSYSKTFPLAFDPPPDTLFMRATGLDLSVFGEDLPNGHLQMIDGESLAGWALESLATALERDLESTVAALVKLSQTSSQPASSDEVRAALASGEFDGSLPAARGAILQAAAFARQLLLAGRHAVASGASVVWEFTGGLCGYDYP